MPEVWKPNQTHHATPPPSPSGDVAVNQDPRPSAQQADATDCSAVGEKQYKQKYNRARYERERAKFRERNRRWLESLPADRREAMRLAARAKYRKLHPKIPKPTPEELRERAREYNRRSVERLSRDPQRQAQQAEAKKQYNQRAYVAIQTNRRAVARVAMRLEQEKRARLGACAACRLAVGLPISPEIAELIWNITEPRETERGSFWWLINRRRKGGVGDNPNSGAVLFDAAPVIAILALNARGIGSKRSCDILRLGREHVGMFDGIKQRLGVSVPNRPPPRERRGPSTRINGTCEELDEMAALERTHDRWWRNAFGNSAWRRSHDRMKRTPELRLKFYLRKKIRAILGARRAVRLKTQELIGCTLYELRQHIERQFLPGMTWENRGTVWHVDHIIPLAKIDIATAEGQKRASHYSNLRPLWARDNIAKGAKILPQFSHLIAA